jgi:hypothetical protein
LKLNNSEHEGSAQMKKLLLLLIPIVVFVNSVFAEPESEKEQSKAVDPEKALEEKSAVEVQEGSGTSKPVEKAKAVVEGGKVYTPKPGSPERKMILDAVRKDLRIANQFEVRHLKVKNGVAYFSGNAMGVIKGAKSRVEKVKALIEKQNDGAWMVSDIWILEKGKASTTEQKAFDERVQKRLHEEPGLERIFTEKI